MNDLVPLTNVLSVPAVLVANSKVPANNLAELIDLLKKRDWSAWARSVGWKRGG